MYRLIIPRSKHRKMLSFAHRTTRLRSKFQRWVEDRAGIQGIHWHIRMIRNDPDAPDYAIEFPSKAHAALFHLHHKFYLVDPRLKRATPTEG